MNVLGASGNRQRAATPRLALCAKEIAIERILLLAEKHALVIHDL